MRLSLSEQEIHFSMSGDDPDTWYAYTDYPRWQRKLESVGAELVRDDGIGKHYRLRADQVLIRKGKRVVPEAQRKAAAKRLRDGRRKALREAAH